MASATEDEGSAVPLVGPAGVAHLAVGMALINPLGGAFAFYRARSMASLIGGAVLGLGFGSAAYKITTNEQARGFRLATMMSVAMCLVHSHRFIKTRRTLPLILATLGLGSGVYHETKRQEWE